ncbi:hypothetical protein ACFZC3_07870 [Streptomyces sp. NPDC007903]
MDIDDIKTKFPGTYDQRIKDMVAMSGAQQAAPGDAAETRLDH